MIRKTRKNEFSHIPRYEDVKKYFSDRGFIDDEAHHFFFVQDQRGWRSKTGKIIPMWQKEAESWIASSFSLIKQNYKDLFKSAS